MLWGQGAWAFGFCRDQQHKSINGTSLCLFPATHLCVADESIFSRIMTRVSGQVRSNRVSSFRTTISPTLTLGDGVFHLDGTADSVGLWNLWIPIQQMMPWFLLLDTLIGRPLRALPLAADTTTSRKLLKHWDLVQRISTDFWRQC